MEPLDFVVIGAGIAGASVAWQLAEQGRVLLLEREAQPGYHTTGRSAALYMETYGTPRIRALTRASRAFLDQPPPGFADSPILSPRGVLYIAGPDQMDLLEATWQELHTHSPSLRRLSPAELVERAPCLRLEALGGGLAESGAADIDVNGLHQGYLHGLRKQGGTVRMNAEVTALTRENGLWTVQLQDGSSVQARTVVNAAGAWADGIAALAGLAPLGIVPHRRTAVIVPAPADMPTAGWPMVEAIGEISRELRIAMFAAGAGSLAALQAHGAAPHMKAYGAKVKDLVAKRVIHILQPVQAG